MVATLINQLLLLLHHYFYRFWIKKMSVFEERTKFFSIIQRVFETFALDFLLINKIMINW